MLKTSSPISVVLHPATLLSSPNESSGRLSGFMSSHPLAESSRSSVVMMSAKSSGATIALYTESERTLLTCSPCTTAHAFFDYRSLSRERSNYTLHLTAGGRFGADFVRTLACRR